MKPKNHTKKSTQSKARVKMLIRSRLAWLSGFPMVVDKRIVWGYSNSSFYHDQTIEVDSNLISKSQRLINTLLRDYPQALPAVAGDAVLWHQRCKAYLQYAKKTIDSAGENFPSLFEMDSSYSKEQRKSLVDVRCQSQILSMLSWKHFINRTKLKSSLLLFKEYLFKNIDIEPIKLLNLATLYSQEPSKSQGLIHFILHTKDLNISTKAEHCLFTPYLKFKTPKAIKKHKNTFNPGDFPVVENGLIIENFIKEISTFNTVQKRRCLEIFASLDLSKKFNVWNHWWQKIKAPCTKLSNHIRLSVNEDVDGILLLQHQINTEFKKKPNDFSVKKTLNAIVLFSKHKAYCPLLINIIQLLSLQSQMYPSNDEFIQYFAQLLKQLKPNFNKFKAYLIGLNNYLKLPIDTIDPQLPWMSLSNSIWGGIDAELLQEATAGQISTFFDVLILIKTNQKLDLRENDLEGLMNWVIGGFNAEVIAEYHSVLYSEDVLDGFPISVVQISFENNLSIKEVLIVLNVWKKLFKHSEYYNGLKAFYKIFKSIHQQDFFIHLLLNQDTKQLLQYSYHIKVISKISSNHAIPLPSAIVPKSADWIEQYPRVFHSILQQLNGIDGKVQNKVKSIFKSTWWPKHFIEFEITNLSEKTQSKNLNTASIQKRIENLKAQLENHQEITKTKIDKITQKLNEHKIRVFFNQWQMKLEQQFLKDWSALFKLDQAKVPSWLISSDLINKLLPILDFNKPSKNMAIKVIQARCNGTYFYLEKEHKNQQFIKNLNDQGIDMNLWPDNFGELSYQAKNEEKIILSIESDPLEILDMGGHFGTCLSPGNFNYFSVFTNIADVNKQVIYARNEKQQVIGRVLIGITSQGALQVFYSYSHHSDYQFNEHVMIFIQDIIDKTGLILSHHGQVESLCCNQWYDDGASQFHHNFSCLEEGSIFRSEIATMSADDFISKLTDAMQPNPINALMFPSLLELPELKENPKVFPALLTLSKSVQNLPISDLLRLYGLSYELGQASSCYQCHRKVIFKYLLNEIYNYYWFDSYTRKIAEHHPSDALRIIKAHAKELKIDWKKDIISVTQDSVYVALKNLGRDQLAERFKPFSE